MLTAKFLFGPQHMIDPRRVTHGIQAAAALDNLSLHHVLRTADMLDLKCLVFARGKVPGEELLEQAQEQGLVVMTTRETAFTACGLLYQAGLRGVPIEWPENEAQK